MKHRRLPVAQYLRILNWNLFYEWDTKIFDIFLTEKHELKCLKKFCHNLKKLWIVCLILFLIIQIVDPVFI